MALPRVRISEISAGLAVLKPGILFNVPNQPVSAVYLAESGPFHIEAGGSVYTLLPGDLVALPGGIAHRIWAGAADRPAARNQRPLNFAQEEPGRNEDVKIFCCRVPASANPLPDVVPAIFVIDKAAQRSLWRLDELFALLRYHALTPSENQGMILRQLAEICATLFLEWIVADYRARGFDLAEAAKDGRIRRVLNAIHAAPERRWTLDLLAQESAMSRSTFTDRFRQTTGLSPMAYLVRYRVELAKRILREGEKSITEIAHAVGYDTDSAFSKAFRKETGTNPRAFQQRVRST